MQIEVVVENADFLLVVQPVELPKLSFDRSEKKSMEASTSLFRDSGEGPKPPLKEKEVTTSILTSALDHWSLVSLIFWSLDILVEWVETSPMMTR